MKAMIVLLKSFPHSPIYWVPFLLCQYLHNSKYPSFSPFIFLSIRLLPLPNGFAQKELIVATKQALDEKLDSFLTTRKPLVYKDNKPIPLRSLNPSFIEKYFSFFFTVFSFPLQRLIIFFAIVDTFLEGIMIKIKKRQGLEH